MHSSSAGTPSQPTPALEQLALQQIRARNFVAAAQLYRQAVDQGNASAAAYSNLAALELQANRIETAAALLEQALQLAPNNAEAWLNLGTAQHALGHSDRAAESFRCAAALKPGFAKAYANLGHALQACNNPQGALDAYNQALALQPLYPEVLSGQGVALRELGQIADSIAALQQALEQRAEYPEAMNNLGLSLQEAGQIERAVHWFERALAISPSQSEILSNLGIALMEQGHLDQAQARFREALRHNPLYPEAHRHLSYCVNGREDPAPRQAAQTCLNELKDQSKAYHLYFCIGKYHLDGQDPEAADWFCKANQSRSAQLEGTWTLPNLSDLIRTNTTLLEQWEAAPTPPQAQPTAPTLIFIVGLPRCGSTLVETILSQNRDLIDLGEVPYLNQAMACGSTIEAIRSSYQAAVEARADYRSDAAALSDKFLYNFAYCPVLAAAFPDCRIVHVHRNPMDNLWSTFTNHFAQGNEWTYSLDHSVAAYHLYRQVMAAHEQRIPGRIYHLNYDHLTQQPEKVIPSLIEHCGFQWDEAYLHPERGRRQIHTASAVQARSPINSRSVGGWQHYQGLLQPYADQLEALGYNTAIEPIA
jgi:tetratricopeptide (TPR) repeat protein